MLQIGLLWSSDLPSTTVLKGLFLSAWCSTPLSLKLPTQFLIVSRWYPQWTPYPPTHFTFNSSLFHAVRFFTEKSITGGHVTKTLHWTPYSPTHFTVSLSTRLFFHAARFCTEKFRDWRTCYNDTPSVSPGLLLADAVWSAQREVHASVAALLLYMHCVLFSQCTARCVAIIVDVG